MSHFQLAFSFSHFFVIFIKEPKICFTYYVTQVVEAHHDFTPLILLTADRPPELHDAGANQSIDQVLILSFYLRYSWIPLVMPL